MKNLTRSMVNFLKCEDGPTAVEYAVMLALIIVVCIIAITALLYWWENRDQVGLLEWAIATAVSGAGVLILGLFGPIPSGGLGVAGNTLIFAGFIIAWESIRRFDGKPAANNLVALLILAFLVIFSTAWSLGAEQ